METTLTAAERKAIRTRVRTVLLRAKLARLAKRTPAQKAASKANIQKAQTRLAKNRLKMWGRG